MAFTFKKVKKQTGLASIGEPTRFEIKFKKNIVGEIRSPFWHEKDETDYQINIKVEGESGFKWLRFKNRFKSSEEAKEWLNENFYNITNKFTLYLNQEN